MVEYSRDSTFNMGIAHLERINSLLYDIAGHAHDGNYEEWHNALCILSREVFFLFTEDEMKTCAELDTTCAESISQFKIEKTFENKTKAYNCLVEFEFFIKQQLAQRKMLMAFGRNLSSVIADVS